MPQRSTTHNFVYTKKDIEDLIKADVAKQMKMATIPIIKYRIDFNLAAIPDDGPGYPSYEFKNVDVKVETPA